MDMSNKSLALLLVAAIVISLGTTLVSLNKLNNMDGISQTTGYATTGAGQVNVSVTSDTACTVDSNVNFGSARPTGIRTLSTDANNNQDFSCDGTTPGTGNCWGIMINNTGNTVLDINMTGDKNATTFLGGGTGLDNVDFQVIVDDTEIEAGSCTTEGITVWEEMNATEKVVCTGLDFTDNSDVVVLDFNVTVRVDTPQGDKTSTITVDCFEQ
jgi:hypothetical protein